MGVALESGDDLLGASEYHSGRRGRNTRGEDVVGDRPGLCTRAESDESSVG